jgi:hypothetical protein
LAGLITDSDLLAHNAFRLRRASLAVHPAVNAISCELTTQFGDGVTAVAQAVDDRESLSPIEIIPPPALLKEDPVVVERIEIVDPTLVLHASHARPFMMRARVPETRRDGLWRNGGYLYTFQMCCCWE